MLSRPTSSISSRSAARCARFVPLERHVLEENCATPFCSAASLAPARDTQLRAEAVSAPACVSVRPASRSTTYGVRTVTWARARGSGFQSRLGRWRREVIRSGGRQVGHLRGSAGGCGWRPGPHREISPVRSGEVIHRRGARGIPAATCNAAAELGHRSSPISTPRARDHRRGFPPPDRAAEAKCPRSCSSGALADVEPALLQLVHQLSPRPPRRGHRRRKSARSKLD